LTDRAIAIVQERAGAEQPFAISNMTMTAAMRRLGLGSYTVHGFRSAFRDWAAERTSYATDVIEAALAHAKGSKVEAAYFRSDLFDKRRRLMDDWAAYVEAPQAAGKVVPIRSASISSAIEA
jgi:integrase